jgi:hypothetical protein
MINFSNNIFSIDCSLLEATAVVNADNSGENSARGVSIPGDGNQADISHSLLNVLAEIKTLNTGLNEAIGLFNGGANSVSIFDSLVNVAALANAEQNDADGTQGTVVAIRTFFNVIENP